MRGVHNEYQSPTKKEKRAAAGKTMGQLAFAGREWIRTFAIVTTEPNELCAQLHNRMPVVLKPEVWPAWFGEEPATASDLKAVLARYPSEDMICWPVRTRVGNVKNNDPRFIEPIAAAWS